MSAQSSGARSFAELEGQAAQGQVAGLLPALANKASGRAIFSVSSYGPYSDGASDDLPAFRACVSACLAAGGGIIDVDVPLWFLGIQSTLLWNGLALGASRLVFRGHGEGTAIRVNCSASLTPIAYGNFEQVCFENLVFFGAGTGAAPDCGSLITGTATQTIFQECVFLNLAAQDELISLPNGFKRFHNCYFASCGTSGGLATINCHPGGVLVMESVKMLDTGYFLGQNYGAKSHNSYPWVRFRDNGATTTVVAATTPGEMTAVHYNNCFFDEAGGWALDIAKLDPAGSRIRGVVIEATSGNYCSNGGRGFVISGVDHVTIKDAHFGWQIGTQAIVLSDVLSARVFGFDSITPGTIVADNTVVSVELHDCTNLSLDSAYAAQKTTTTSGGDVTFGGAVTIQPPTVSSTATAFQVNTGTSLTVGMTLKGVVKSANVTFVSLTSNLATLTTAAAHTYNVGATVQVTGLTNAFFDGIYTITAVTSTTFSYALTHANVANTADTGVATVDQTADLLQAKLGSGTILSGIDANCRIYAGGPPDTHIPLTLRCVVSDAGTLDSQFGAASGPKVAFIECDGSQGIFAAQNYQSNTPLPVVIGGSSVNAGIGIGQDATHRFVGCNGNTVTINPDNWLYAGASPFAIAGCTAQSEPLLLLEQRTTGTPLLQPCAAYDAVWATSTQGSQKGRAVISACDFTGTNREGFRVESDGTQGLVALGGGTLFRKILSATATLDFPSTAAQTSSDLTVSVAGASVGDSVSLGLPATPPANASFSAWVSAADTITVRLHNYSSGAIDPASGTYRATIIKF